ncbi:MAG: DUF4105 domain-containing protein [Muribaculaceae bacterium]|nr:DUF4105 domain-containing protein [Muribaculaceae bacterium]
MKKALSLLVALLVVLTASAAIAEVEIVNFYPGNDIYELEGHTALKITTDDGNELAVSYGEFDFDSPGFVYRFVKGETDYRMGVHPWELFEYPYRRQQRRIVAHRIDMDSVQLARLEALLVENMKPENVVYRYNYVKDNCATRPLRIVEKALGDSILLGPTAFDAESAWPVTFRNVMRHYHQNYPWYQFGIDLALGSGIDYPINFREEAFAPVILDSQLTRATVSGHPLVKETTVICDYPADNAVQGPTPWLWHPLTVCWLWFIITAMICLHDLRRKHVTRWFQAFAFAIMGLAGLVLAFLVFISVHEATSPNWLLAWLNPLCLIVPLFIWLKKCKTVVFSYQIVNFAVLLLLLLSWCFIPQSTNAAFLPLVLADMAMAATYIAVYRNN